MWYKNNEKSACRANGTSRKEEAQETKCLLALLVAATVMTGAIGGDDLLATFRAPPDSARPEVWWHWMNGNVSRDGIVADLDAMAVVGLGGVTIFDA